MSVQAPRAVGEGFEEYIYTRIYIYIYIIHTYMHEVFEEYINIYIYIHTHIHTYIYIQMHIDAWAGVTEQLVKSSKKHEKPEQNAIYVSYTTV
jgi:hypothetical protein